MFVRMDAGSSRGAPRRVLRGPRPQAVPQLVAGACVLAGLLDVAAGVLPPARHHGLSHLAQPLPGALAPYAAALALGSGVLVLLLARDLGHRERRARRAALVLLPLGACAQGAYRPSVVGVVVPLLLLWPLVTHREQFAAPPDPHGRRRAPATFVLMGAGSILLGLVVVSAHPDRLVGDPSLAERLEHVLYGLFGVAGPLHYTGQVASTVTFSLRALGTVTVLTTVWLACRPGRPAARLGEDDAARLRALLVQHGDRAAARRVVWRRDKGVVFSPSGKAAVRYRVVSGVMLATGDPVGAKEAWPGAIERFMDEARAHAWTPAVTGCSRTAGEVWTHETGLTLHQTPTGLALPHLPLGQVLLRRARARAGVEGGGAGSGGAGS